MRTLFWLNEIAAPFKKTATDFPSSKLTLDPDSDTKSSKILPLKLILKESDFQAFGS